MKKEDIGDTIENLLNRSQISKILKGARQDINRPTTPELPRHLFSGEEYSNRPSSAYNVQNMVGRTLDELNKELEERDKNSKYELIPEEVAKEEDFSPEKDSPISQIKNPHPPLRESTQYEESKIPKRKSQKQAAGKTISHKEKPSVDENKDEFEEYFEKGIVEDIETIKFTSELLRKEKEKESASQYHEFNQKIQSLLNTEETKDDESCKYKNTDDEIEFEERLLCSRDSLSDYEKEFDDILGVFSKLTKEKDNSLETVTQVCMRVWVLVDEWESQPLKIQTHRNRQTLLKGILALMRSHEPAKVIRLCKCSIHIFHKLYKEYKLKLTNNSYNEFFHIFNSLLTTIKILYKFSKTSENDKYFQLEKLFSEIMMILEYFIKEKEIFVKCSDKIIKKSILPKKEGEQVVRISNDSNVYDLLLYLMGIIKNITMEVNNRNTLISQNAFPIFTKILTVILNDTTILKEKVPQILVQITGVLRHLASELSLDYTHYIPMLIQILRRFNTHKELVLNTSRILSKLSLNQGYAGSILKANSEDILIELIMEYKEHPAIFVRIAFILGNLTMIFGNECKYAFTEERSLEVCMSTLLFYLKMWHARRKSGGIARQTSGKSLKNFEEFSKQFSDDVVIKSMRLFANLWIDKSVSERYIKSNKEDLMEIIILNTKIIIHYNEHHQELLLHTLSSISNILFYDQSENAFIKKGVRKKLVETCLKLAKEDTGNDNMIESIRILCNLSRHKEVRILFNDLSTIQILVKFLSHKIREVIYYTVGLFINISADFDIRKLLYDERLDLMIKLLNESNFEDIEMSKLLCKLFANMCDVKTKHHWKNEQIKEVDSLITMLGEECDSSLDVANAEEKLIIEEFHGVLNGLINSLPEATHSCNFGDCGRKFKTLEELNKHQERRHGKK